MQHKPWLNMLTNRQKNVTNKKPNRDRIIVTFDKSGEFIDVDMDVILEAERQAEHHFREEFLKTVKNDD
ncbi:MAG: hypothetical protein D6711_09590 [Chloroflexi bacterium]|nr:MAG: hypothetical protein D6711_09590 [Chloroflexota bacterium]